jgi:hypothetical protein
MLPKPLADALHNELKAGAAPRDRVRDEEQIRTAARYLANHPKAATLGNIARAARLPAKNKTTILGYMKRKDGAFWQFAINEANQAYRVPEDLPEDKRLRETLKRRKMLRETLKRINELRMQYDDNHRIRMRYDKWRVKQIERRPRGLGRVRPGYLGPPPLKGEKDD